MSSAHTDCCETVIQFTVLCVRVLPDDKPLLKWRHLTFHLQEVFPPPYCLLLSLTGQGASPLSLIGTSRSLSGCRIGLAHRGIANLNEVLCAVTDRVMMSVQSV